MTSEITRRAALSLVGAGTTVFLSACAATNVFVGTQEDASSPSASPKDYKGEAKLEEYDTSAGTFEPATHDTPPKNVPKPIKPKNADEDSVAGLYSSIAFLGRLSPTPLLRGIPHIYRTRRSTRKQRKR